jgi:diaminohydroxyphosphoribosylaminopyrimidine deaminase/5-amino-6-(5-phosphoribosylamino)uracil reductase
MAADAERLNEKYLHFLRTGRPFIHLKLATSLDGKIATRTGDSRWITGEQSLARVHELRHEYDAILIGAGTAMKDDPLLTDRSGQPRRRPLLRVVLDENLQVSSESQLVKTAHEAPTLVFAGRNADADKTKRLESQGVEVVRDDANGANGRDLLSVMGELAKRSEQSVLIEGGAGIAGKFLDAGFVNKVSFFIAPVIIGGREAPSAIGGTGTERIVDATQLEGVEIVHRGPDIEVTGYPTSKRLRMKAEG